MSRTPFEVADVFRLVEPQLASLRLSPEQYRVFRAVVSCRTEKLGAHVRRCTTCNHPEQSYNSCWNRHCPKCQGGEAFAWARDRTEDLLPVPYFHVVFTLPSELKQLTYANKELLYNILYEASSATITDVSRNNLQITPGFFGVLHTWNQQMQFHPHLHYIIPGGGLDTSTKAWRPFSASGKFFLPVRILSKVFRGKFIEKLKSAYQNNKLYLPESLRHLSDPKAFEHFISRAASKEWVVYAKRPFAGPEVVVKYLANYTHKVGISNRRLRQITPGSVTFMARTKDSHGKQNPVTISPQSFVRRFMLHLLPRGFRRIRHFGFLAPHQKEQALATIRRDLNVPAPVSEKPPLNTCPVCRLGTLEMAELHKPHRWCGIRVVHQPITTITDSFQPP